MIAFLNYHMILLILHLQYHFLNIIKNILVNVRYNNSLQFFNPLIKQVKASSSILLFAKLTSFNSLQYFKLTPIGNKLTELEKQSKNINKYVLMIMISCEYYSVIHFQYHLLMVDFLFLYLLLLNIIII